MAYADSALGVSSMCSFGQGEVRKRKKTAILHCILSLEEPVEKVELLASVRSIKNGLTWQISDLETNNPLHNGA